MTPSVGPTLSDGIITVRTPVPDDRDALIGVRDEQFHRFMGEGSPDPRPTFCIVVDDRVVGWVDAEHEDTQHWLEPHEANLGYALHPDHRGKGCATRAVQLLMSHLARTGQWSVATLAIDFGNDWSLAIARRCGFEEHGTITGDKESRFFKRPVPPLTYTDGVVTIRPHILDDAAADLAVTDEEQITWMWPEHRDDWLAKSPEEQLEHKRGNMRANVATFATGPKWPFAIVVDGALVGMVECDLANPYVPAGEANISYSIGPDHRGHGYVSAAVRLILQFVRDHTGAREAHIVVNPGNTASLRVARAAGAQKTERFVGEHGNTMVRHVLPM